jgi:uncharacterized membrane protein YdjX (TVP38/TMEM64 family)
MSKDINQFIKDLFGTKFILPLVLILGFIFFFYLDLDSFFSWKNISANYSEIKLISQENILYSAFIFFLIHFLAIVLSLPIVGILLILGGALFGWLAVFLLFSSTLGCWVVFFAARGFLFEYLSKKANPYMSSITTNFNKSPFIWLFYLKLFPLLPIWVGNIVPGVLGMKSSTFLLATFLGFFPGTIIYVSFAIGLDKILINGGLPNYSITDNLEIYIPLLMLAVISITSIVIKSLQIKRGNNQ